MDFDTLKSVNPDVVGWIYIEALDNINYPVVQGDDNETYLHTTYENNYNFAGTIFVDYENSSDFSDCNTLIYGRFISCTGGKCNNFVLDRKLSGFCFNL